MKRIRLIAIIVLSFVFIGAMIMITGAIANDKERATVNSKDTLAEAISNENNWIWGRMNEITEKIQNTPIYELPENEFMIMNIAVGSRNVIPIDAGSTGSEIKWFNNTAGLKIYNIQWMDEDNISVVYKVSEKDKDPAYAFVIFRRESINDGTREEWMKTGEVYFMNGARSIDDYSTAAIGDPVESLYSIDTSVYYDVMRKEINQIYWNSLLPIVDNDQKGDDDYSSEHYYKVPRMICKVLKEGILIIGYNLEDMVVNSIDFYPFEEKNIPDGISVNSSVLTDCFTVKN
jgi:hypothetical protein